MNRIIRDNNDAYIMNREYEYICLSKKMIIFDSDNPSKRVYLYNDGCKPWEDVNDFHKALLKFKELTLDSKIENMGDKTLMLLNIFPNM
jgi:hypothetical protein